MLKKYTATQAQALFNQYAEKQEPFFFLISYDQQQCIVLKKCEWKSSPLKLFIKKKPIRLSPNKTQHALLNPSPPDFKTYIKAFNKVQQHIRQGNTYLCNLTFSTPIKTDLSLQQIYNRASAKYKLLWKDRFVLFSPESFVQINQNKISTFPMKGTIDGKIPNAQHLLEKDPKEAAEHATIVDLLRNDLSRVAQKVRVKKYRYYETIQTHRGPLIQSSSHIEGYLPKGWQKKLGYIFFSLLPAGSVTGAPKTKTLQIIAEAETHKRNFYTGVFGLFDGQKLDSAVAIRFIEQTPNGLVFKSGGGITAFSQAEKEYQELIDKIYLPIHHDK